MEMYYPALGKQEEMQSERKGAAWGCTSLDHNTDEKALETTSDI